MAKDPYKLIKWLKNNGWDDLYDADRVNKKIPVQSGVYCFVRYDSINSISQIVYVGKSCNLSVRLKPCHKIENRFDKKLGCLFCFILLTNDHDSIEIDYIKKFSPIYNIQHNAKISKK